MPGRICRARLEISGIASQFAIQNARFAIHNKLMHSKIANHLKKNRFRQLFNCGDDPQQSWFPVLSRGVSGTVARATFCQSREPAGIATQIVKIALQTKTMNSKIAPGKKKIISSLAVKVVSVRLVI